MKEEKPIIPEEVVMSKIFVLRDQRIMLDRDLAELYDVKSRRLREQVKGIKIASLRTLCLG